MGRLSGIPRSSGNWLGSSPQCCWRRTSFLSSYRLHACTSFPPLHPSNLRRSIMAISVDGCQSTYVLKRFGQQRTASLGMAICGVSLILSSFVTRSIPGLIAIQGVLFGAGGSMIYLVSASSSAHRSDADSYEKVSKEPMGSPISCC